MTKIMALVTALMISLLVIDVMNLLRAFDQPHAVSIASRLLSESAAAEAPSIGPTQRQAPAVPTAQVGAAPSLTAESPSSTEQRTGELCGSTTACTASAPATKMSADQTQIISALNDHAAAVELRVKQLEERKRLLEAAEHALERRVSSAETPAHRDALVAGATPSRDDMAKLGAIYQTMKPADAAAIFDILDLRVCVSLLQSMSPRKASAIMALMVPERAILATQMLARRQNGSLDAGRDGG